MRIGLLGGSFNPPHAGHVHISHEAIKRLHLDAVLWLVSPANPFKDLGTLAPYEQRLHLARTITRRDPRLLVSDIEQREELYYTVETLRYLCEHYPRHRFVWLMGADNLRSFHRWEGWEEIAATVPIAVMDRAPGTCRSLHAKAARRLEPYRMAPEELIRCRPPAWTFLFIRRHPLSATALRKTLGAKAFALYPRY